MNRTKIAGIVAALVVIVAAAGVIWWQTSEESARQVGSCDNATFVLESEREDNMTEVSFELQATAPGQEWEVQILQGDQVLTGGSRITDEDAEIDVDAYAVEGAPGGIAASAIFEDVTCSAALPAN